MGKRDVGKSGGGMWKIEEKPSRMSKEMTTAWACHGKRDVSVCLAFGKFLIACMWCRKSGKRRKPGGGEKNSVAYLCAPQPTDRLKAFVIKKAKICTPTKHLPLYSGNGLKKNLI